MEMENFDVSPYRIHPSGKKQAKRFKRSKRIGKGGGLLLVALIAGAVMTGAMMYTYFANIGADVVVNELFVLDHNEGGTWVSDIECGDYDLVVSDGICPGDSKEFNFNITLNADADNNRYMKFTVNESLDDGINVTIKYLNETELDDNSILLFTPGETKQFIWSMETSLYTPAGTYNNMGVLLEAYE